MKHQDSIETRRLILRPLAIADAARVQTLAGNSQIAAMTENIPHPYEQGMAEIWINSLHAGWEAQNQAGFAFCLKENQDLIGCCGLNIVKKHKRASLGYWVGIDYWGNGYCTEAAAAVIEFGFSRLHLHRIEAQHLSKNPASGAVMKKIGMQHEATMLDYVYKENSHHNMEQYSILR